jgi:hypothetical protein
MLASEVVALNNSAVASLLNGRPEKALALLSTAATAISKKHFADKKAPCSRSSLIETPLPHRQSEISRFVSESSTHHQSNLSSSKSSSASCTNDGDEYSSAMEINVERDRPSVLSFQLRTRSLSQDASLILSYSRALAMADDVKDKKLLASVVLYNRALVNHCRAIELGISRLLPIALNLYKRAASVLERYSDIDESNELVLLALYNNMAQIHAYQWSSQEVRVCIDNIRMLLSTVLADSFIDEEDYLFFHINTMLHVEEMNLAPAA